MGAATISDLERLRSAHRTVAKLVVADPAYVPVFRRIEADIAEVEARQADDPVARARAFLAQSATA